MQNVNIQLKYFKEREFNNFGKMDIDFLKTLDEFREFAGKPIIIHSDYRDNSERHKSGQAVDIRIVGFDVLDMYFLAEKFGKFKGIGIYPNWNNPGLHIDTFKSGRWLAYNSGTRQEYTALNSENIKRYVLPII